MIAGKERALLKQRETEMIGAVARRSDGLDGEAPSAEPLSVAEDSVGNIVAVVRIVRARAIAFRRKGHRADDSSAGGLPQPVRKRAVIAVGVGDEIVSTLSPSTAARIAARWKSSLGPGSTTATAPLPTT